MTKKNNHNLLPNVFIDGQEERNISVQGKIFADDDAYFNERQLKESESLNYESIDSAEISIKVKTD